MGAIACGPPAQMVVPSELGEQSHVLVATDRSKATGMLANEGFKLGNYQVAEVDRDWNSESSFGAGAYGAGKKTTGYTYELKSGAGTWKGTCASLAKGQNVGGFSFGNSTNVTCECASGSEKIKLVIGGETEATIGTLEFGDKKLDVLGVNETDKSYYGKKPVGYRVDEGDRPFAGVELIRPGRVWLNKDLNETEAAATSCALVGMMLYLPPDDN